MDLRLLTQDTAWDDQGGGISLGDTGETCIAWGELLLGTNDRFPSSKVWIATGTMTRVSIGLLEGLGVSSQTT